MRQTAVTSAEAPKALGPYSQAVSIGDLVFCSGQLGLDPISGELVSGVAAQAERSMRNLAAVLEAAGSGLDRIVKTTIFLANMGDFAAVNEVYGSFFSGAYPARSTVQVAGLPKGGLVEIEAVALGGSR
ncbi:MAG TPA: RidA family protein [Rectinemataceae bacterium]|nr:RidA family protein [Rectinemataceae bacterium]